MEFALVGDVAVRTGPRRRHRVEVRAGREQRGHAPFPPRLGGVCSSPVPHARKPMESGLGLYFVSGYEGPRRHDRRRVGRESDPIRIDSAAAAVIGAHVPRVCDWRLAAVFRSCPVSASSTECESVSFESFFAIVVSFP